MFVYGEFSISMLAYRSVNDERDGEWVVTCGNWAAFPF